MPSNAETIFRFHGLLPVARLAIVAVASIGVASCGGGPGGGQPDLVVESPLVSDDRPAAGATYTFSATVRNAGRGPAAATKLRVYRSDDATITPADEQVGAATVDALAATAHRIASVKLTAPANAGTYRYGACVDAAGGESETANNCSAAVEVTVPDTRDTSPASPLPDLVVESPAVGADTPAAGATFTLSVTVRNAGGGNASATTLLAYLSEDDTIETDDERVGTGTVGELAASAHEIASLKLTAPTSAGTYYYGACVEPAAGESHTANNCSAAVQVTVPDVQGTAPPAPQPATRGEGPDLVADHEVLTSENLDRPSAGVPFTLTMSVRNDGRTRSAATTVRFYHSTDATITRTDTQVFAGRVPRLYFWLSGWGFVRVSATLQAPSNPGTHYYGACVDAVAGESDTTNNCSRARSITVPRVPPDLEMVSPSVVPGSPAIGGRFNLYATVRNVGGGLVWRPKLTYYRSEDATITTSDTKVGANTTHILDPSVSRRIKLTLQTPSSRGTYYYGACADAMAGESDTTNNCSQAVQVKVSHDKPNLLVLRPWWQTHAGTLNMYAIVLNHGADFEGAPRLRFYHSTDATITTSDTEISAAEFSWRCCDSGAFDYFIGGIEVPRPSAPGTQYYGACVDVVPGESDTDNCSPSVTPR